ncbi:hypothetical protein [Arthrobacter sp.]|uniref:hypothetical protein n=1 Tax=Arthrobacter sp. TaxID=1667 RepID=UPI002810F392|nr:hypothetical protein [Arthrobacter sp.]
MSHNPAVRAGLQVLAVTSLFALLPILNNPIPVPWFSLTERQTWWLRGRLRDKAHGVQVRVLPAKGWLQHLM